MADPEHELDAPPVGEDIHLPAPTFMPIAMALGITLTLVGLTLTYALTAVGLIIFLVTLVRWIRSTRRDIAELPAEH